jgi:serine/threonine-protein kinase HipA
VERGNETAEDLKYLLGKGTSLGGMRPKCTVLEEDSSLARGKFPSVNDARNVTRAEVLALRLAQRAGIDAAHARIVQIGNAAVAVIRRFDTVDSVSSFFAASKAETLQVHDSTSTLFAALCRSLEPLNTPFPISMCVTAPTHESRQFRVT